MKKGRRVLCTPRLITERSDHRRFAVSSRLRVSLAGKRNLVAWCVVVLAPLAFDSTSGHYGLTDKMSEYEKSNIRLSTMCGIRTDMRRSMDARPVTLEVAVLPDAFGSARVRMGRTDVVAAVELIESPLLNVVVKPKTALIDKVALGS